MEDPGEVTNLLRRWKIDGDHEAEEALFSLVMTELQREAGRVLWRNPGLERKVDPRELVSEAYLRLADYQIDTTNRKTFFFLMARAMRHYLVDLARRDGADRRPPSQLRVVDSHVLNSLPTTSEMGVLDFYDALDALGAVDHRQAQAIELRVMGFENEDIAEELDVSVATVKRDVAKARAFLAYRLGLSAGWITA
jgi:RNA polymerase sigma factor (TIGR02999 family)